MTTEQIIRANASELYNHLAILRGVVAHYEQQYPEFCSVLSAEIAAIEAELTKRGLVF